MICGSSSRPGRQTRRQRQEKVQKHRSAKIRWRSRQNALRVPWALRLSDIKSARLSCYKRSSVPRTRLLQVNCENRVWNRLQRAFSPKMYTALTPGTSPPANFNGLRHIAGNEVNATKPSQQVSRYCGPQLGSSCGQTAGSLGRLPRRLTLAPSQDHTTPLDWNRGSGEPVLRYIWHVSSGVYALRRLIQPDYSQGQSVSVHPREGFAHGFFVLCGVWHLEA